MFAKQYLITKKMTSYYIHFIFVMCYCILAGTYALPSGLFEHSDLFGTKDSLESVPTFQEFGEIKYPQLDVIELGETAKEIPERQIKVIRTITLRELVPVKVPIKVPYPVPVEKPVPVEVTKLVHVPISEHDMDGKERQSSYDQQQQQHSQNHNEDSYSWSQEYHDAERKDPAEGHVDETAHFASAIAQQAADYQQNYPQAPNDHE